MDSQPLFRTVNLGKYYPSIKAYALQGVNVAIGEGEFVAIKGPSGSGKSTLLYILGGLMQSTEGEAYFRGKDLCSIKNKSLYRRNNIGFVFQDFYLYAHFSVLDNVLFPHSYQVIVGKSLVQRAQTLLETFGIGDKSRVKVDKLSAGERQRVCIARALLHEPRCILADEPTGNLDSRNAVMILSMLRAINEAQHTTILLVTHDDKVADYSHRTIHVVDGSVAD